MHPATTRRAAFLKGFVICSGRKCLQLVTKLGWSIGLINDLNVITNVLFCIHFVSKRASRMVYCRKEA